MSSSDCQLSSYQDQPRTLLTTTTDSTKDPKASQNPQWRNPSQIMCRLWNTWLNSSIYKYEYIYVFVYIHIYIYTCLSVCLSICYLPICLFIKQPLSLRLRASLCLCMSVSLSLSLSLSLCVSSTGLPMRIQLKITKMPSALIILNCWCASTALSAQY